MPSFGAPDYVHLRMAGTADNESQMQLMTEEPSPAGSPCFNGPAATAATADSSVPRISYKSGKSTARWWSRRTMLEKMLLAACLLLLLLSIVLLAVVVFRDRRAAEPAATDRVEPLPGADASPHVNTPPPPPSSTPPPPSPTTAPSTPEEKQPEICTTPGCVRAANNLLNAMNTSIDPCSDFYEYACGAWNRDHPIPDDMFAYGTFAYVREQVRQQLRVLLETSESSASKSINMARIAYKTCMNTEQLDQLKTSLLLNALTSMGHWPLLHPGKWTKQAFKLTHSLAEARRDYGTDVFFQVYVYADAKNTSKNTLFVDQGGLALGRGSRDYYLNETIFSSHMNAYKKYMTEIVKILQLDANVSRAEVDLERDMKEMVAFETELARIIVPEDDRRNNTRMNNKRTVADLYDYMPQVEWIDFFKTIAPTELQSYFDNETSLIVAEIEYMRKVSQLIDSTDSRIVNNYLLWRVVYSSIRFLDDRFETIKQDFQRVMTGQQMRSPRWKECAQVPSTFLPLAAGAIYIHRHFNSNDKKEAEAMIKNLQSSFEDLVSENDWMDGETKEVAIAKAKSMINHIGYPDLITDDGKLDEQYVKLVITPSDTYFGMMQKAVVWMQEKEFMKLKKPFDRNEFDVSPAVVNAFYSPEKNAITFPAGILQPPFFSGSFPKAVNYGAIGAVIGHEITHGFDDQGSQYDKNGNLENWWNADSLAGFNKRRECIVNQYGNYTVPDTTFKVNGKLTQGENIADNGGVKEAYRAYRKYVSSLGGEEPRLPGLTDMTNDQVFFLSYAHFWCGHKTAAAAVQQVLTDEHSPEVFRVIGVLSNLEEFSQAYNCPAGSRLNPTDKCVVW